MHHKNRKIGARQHMTSDTAKDNFPNTTMAVSPHHKKVRARVSGSSQQGLTKVVKVGDPHDLRRNAMPAEKGPEPLGIVRLLSWFICAENRNVLGAGQEASRLRYCSR